MEETLRVQGYCSYPLYPPPLLIIAKKGQKGRQAGNRVMDHLPFGITIKSTTHQLGQRSKALGQAGQAGQDASQGGGPGHWSPLMQSYLGAVPPSRQQCSAFTYLAASVNRTKNDNDDAWLGISMTCNDWDSDHLKVPHRRQLIHLLRLLWSLLDAPTSRAKDLDSSD